MHLSLPCGYTWGMNTIREIRAVLLDLDGVLYVGDQMIAGADAAIAALRHAGYRLAGLTNTTTQSRRMIAEKLARLGLELKDDDIYTPAALARAAIGNRRARLYIRDVLREDIADIVEDETAPEVIVMGDIGGEGYPPETLRQIFLHVMHGAEILALHKNRFWQKPDGLHLDLGAFVAAIEYASGCKATILGKPSPDFFHGVCQALDVPPQQAMMIGDDVESDVVGALHAGLHAALVHTGKYRQAFVHNFLGNSDVKPDMELASIAELPERLNC